MDIDAISEEEGEPREALLCPVCHGGDHLSNNKGIPRKKKGNHSLPRNLQKKKSPYPATNHTKLASFMKEHDISAEKVLELIKPYYHRHPGETTKIWMETPPMNHPRRLEPPLNKESPFLSPSNLWKEEIRPRSLPLSTAEP